MPNKDSTKSSVLDVVPPIISSTVLVVARGSWGVHSRLVWLRVISLACGCLSLAGVLFAYYWFVRMRRSYRHE
jgi:hypothetical protein